MKSGHLIVMSRAPRYGMGKRRLAAEVGDLAAWRFHRQTTALLLRRLSGPPHGLVSWRCWLALTPDSCLRRPRGLWPAPGWRLLPQGRGDLGQKMARLLSRLPPGPVVLVGSDIPDLGRAHITAAFKALARAPWDHTPWVLGPALDEGYWLIGCRRRTHFRLPEKAALSWASCQQLAALLQQQEGRAVEFLPPLRDVDHKADLVAVRLGKQRLAR